MHRFGLDGRRSPPQAGPRRPSLELISIVLLGSRIHREPEPEANPIPEPESELYPQIPGMAEYDVKAALNSMVSNKVTPAAAAENDDDHFFG